MNRLTLSVALVVGLLASCMSSRARDQGLLPAARLSWGSSSMGVRADIERGVNDAVADGELADPADLNTMIASLDSALAAGDRTQLVKITWASLEPYGQRGIQDRIDDGEMDPMVALSLRERLTNFGFALSKLQQLYVYLPLPERREHWLPNGGGRSTAEAVAAATPVGS